MNLYTCSISVITETRLHVDATIIRCFRTIQFHVSYRRRMPTTSAWHRSGLVDACQSAKMAPVLNSLFFSCLKCRPFLTISSNSMLNNSVKWCSGIVCNWCVSLDFALITTNVTFVINKTN